MIEAAVSFGLIALGGSVWVLARIARNVYRHRGHERDTSFLARLFANDPPPPGGDGDGHA